jgi:hypothetical protein
MHRLTQIGLGIVRRAVSAMKAQFVRKSTANRYPADLDCFVGYEDLAPPRPIIAASVVNKKVAANQSEILKMVNYPQRTISTPGRPYPVPPAPAAASPARGEQPTNIFGAAVDDVSADIWRERSSGLKTIIDDALTDSHAV